MSRDIPRNSRGWDAHNSHTDMARANWDEFERIAEEARRQGLNANAAMVSRHPAIWRRWAIGQYATGYLMRATGVRKI